MGRHAAADGDARHPVVAAALAGRGADAGGAHREDLVDRSATQRIRGDLGWPGEPPAREGGLGWPGDLADGLPGSATGEVDGAAEEEDLADQAGPPSGEPAVRRRGWRRLLGLAA